jgi:hypothetical protein
MESFEQVLGQIGVEVVGNLDLAAPCSETPGRLGFIKWHKARNRFASARDDDFFASGGSIDQSREMRLGRVDVHDLAHGLDLVQSNDKCNNGDFRPRRIKG